MSTDSWIATSSGLWSAAGNWNLGEPNPTETAAIVETLLTVTFDLTAAIAGALKLSGATLDLEGGQLGVRNGATLTGATVTGTKSLALYGASTIAGLTVAGSAEFSNAGTVTQSNGAVTIGDSSASKAEIYNKAGATWIIADDSGINQTAASGWSFFNAGTFQKTDGSGTALIQANFYSTGVISSAGGGDIEFDGYSHLSGTFIGSGMIDYGPHGVAAVGVVNVTAACCQTNWGLVKLVGDMMMNDGCTIVNDTGARWDFDGDSSLLLASGQSAGPDINGAGLVEKTAGTGVSTIGIDASLSGEIDVATGTLAFSGETSAFMGAIEGAGVFEIAGGQALFYPSASLSVANWTLSGGDTTLTQSLTYKGVFLGKTGATVTLQNDQFLTFSGSTTINHQVEIFGLAINGAGYVQLDADTAISAATIGGTVQVDDLFVVSQTGNIVLGDTSASDAADLNIVDGGDWSLLGSASISVGADVRSTINIGLSSGGDNAEVLTKAGTGVSVVAPNVVNDCSNFSAGPYAIAPHGVVVQSGTLDFQGSVEGTGTVTMLGNNGNNQNNEPTLEFDGAVGAGQTVLFFGASVAALYLTDLPAFAAAIDGFDNFENGDAILIGGDYRYLGATETATATTLSFVQSGHTAVGLTLTGDYVGHSFNASETGGVLRVQ